MGLFPSSRGDGNRTRLRSGVHHGSDPVATSARLTLSTPLSAHLGFAALCSALRSLSGSNRGTRLTVGGLPISRRDRCGTRSAAQVGGEGDRTGLNACLSRWPHARAVGAKCAGLPCSPCSRVSYASVRKWDGGTKTWSIRFALRVSIVVLDFCVFRPSVPVDVKSAGQRVLGMRSAIPAVSR